MATNISSTKLDFANIKNSLKTYLANKSEFSDYNFEASGLSNILDVLAYNTHYNALTANFALNEAYLNTAQLRSSVVAHAATLGYEVRSMTGSTASITMTLNLGGVANRPGTITVPSGYLFTTKVGDVSYVFQTQQNHTATDDGNGLYNFLNDEGGTSLSIKEGIALTKTFYVGEVGERQLYVIPDSKMDTTSAVVNVYPSANATVPTVYSKLSDAVTVSSTSTYYQISEAPNGYYELNFGDGISFGKAPAPGSKVVVEYLQVSGADANSASTFTPQNTITVNGVQYNPAIATVANSSNGDSVQSIESIRANAPIAFAAQQRLVTAEDYKAVILKNYPVVEDAISWGGEDNTPATYGAVFVSLKFPTSTSAAVIQATKDSIVNNVTNNLSIISIDTKFSDPVLTYVELGCTFNFDPSLSSLTTNSIESNVLTTINTYFTDNLKKFGSIFRRSNLLAAIDSLSPAILNSKVDVKIQQRFDPTLNVATTYVITFPVNLAAADDVNYVITSSTFIINSKLVSIKNRLGSTTLQIVDGGGVVIIDNAGSYEPLKGTVTLTGFAPVSIAAGTTFIKLTATPANPSTIRPLKNYILDIDTDPTYANSVVDNQNIISSITAGVQTSSGSSSGGGGSGGGGGY